MSAYRQALIEEIQFWKELIDDASCDHRSPEQERMQYALQLAERKLSNYELNGCSPARESARH